MPPVSVIIAAGGKGTRMGGRTPKQFLPLGGVPVLRRTIALFHRQRGVREIIVVVPRSCLGRTRRLVRSAGFNRVSAIVAGGKERQDSVFRGLEMCTWSSGVVLVHDAVRPLVDRRTIEAVMRAAARHGAAVAGIPVKDTIKTESERPRGFFTRTLRRDRLWAVQTPQGFRFPLLWEAHRKARAERFRGTDESSLVERLGIAVRIVPGGEENIKITTPADRKLAELLLKGRNAR